MLDGPINADVSWPIRANPPALLRAGDTVILDKLSGQGAMRRRVIAGARLLFLQPYSPDLNAIELAFAKRKELLR